MKPMTPTTAWAIMNSHGNILADTIKDTRRWSIHSYMLDFEWMDLSWRQWRRRGYTCRRVALIDPAELAWLRDVEAAYSGKLNQTNGE